MNQAALLFSFVLLLFLSGCAAIRQDSSTHPLPPAQTSAQTPQLTTDRVLPLSQIEKVLEQNDYLEAFQLLQTDLKLTSSNPDFSSAWVQTLNGLLEQAEDNLADEKPFAAGLLYRKVVDTLPRIPPLPSRIAINHAEINTRLEHCADLLLERGMRSYREGDLPQALAIWNQINSFHNQHTASQRAIETTRRQLQNLAELPAS